MISIFEEKNIPDTWVTTELISICEINPKLDKSQFEDTIDVSFVPMPAVAAESGKIDISETRTFAQVKKGYTAFQKGDVLFAKITPCMENGKMAIAPKLTNNLGFGSTEFHVLRPYSNVSANYVYYFVSSKLFRIKSEHNMTGAVGQRRVPAPWLSEEKLPLPPFKEQLRIVAKIEELFSELDNGIESLETAQEQLKVYRQSLLKHAFEGKLTEQWRKDNPDKLESAEQLIERIKNKRDLEFLNQVKLWEVAVLEWEQNGQEGKKPPKPRKLPTVAQENEGRIPQSIPKEWCSLQLKDIVLSLGQGWSPRCENIPSKDNQWGVIKTSAIQNRKFVPEENKLLPDSLFPRKWLNIEQDDILITRAGPRKRVGIVCRVKESANNLMLCDKAYRIRFPKQDILPQFVEMLCNTTDFSRQIEELKTGISDSGLNITQPKLLGLYAPIPPLEEQKLILSLLEEKLSTVDVQLIEVENNIKKSEALRQSILKKAFSGQLVPQDQNDEPASELLKRITEEKAAIEAEAKAATAAARKAKSKALTK